MLLSRKLTEDNNNQLRKIVNPQWIYVPATHAKVFKPQNYSDPKHQTTEDDYKDPNCLAESTKKDQRSHRQHHRLNRNRQDENETSTPRRNSTKSPTRKVSNSLTQHTRAPTLNQSQKKYVETRSTSPLRMATHVGPEF